MWWLIAFGVFAVIYALSRLAIGSNSTSTRFNGEDASAVSSSSLGSADSTSSSTFNPATGLLMVGALDIAGNLYGSSAHDDTTNSINPANGLPMMGGVDIEGNAYGTDSHLFDHAGTSSFDDLFSSSSSSSFDDSFSSSSSFSSFD